MDTVIYELNLEGRERNQLVKRGDGKGGPKEGACSVKVYKIIKVRKCRTKARVNQ